MSLINELNCQDILGSSLFISSCFQNGKTTTVSILEIVANISAKDILLIVITERNI